MVSSTKWYMACKYLLIVRFISSIIWYWWWEFIHFHMANTMATSAHTTAQSPTIAPLSISNVRALSACAPFTLTQFFFFPSLSLFHSLSLSPSPRYQNSIFAIISRWCAAGFVGTVLRCVAGAIFIGISRIFPWFMAGLALVLPIRRRNGCLFHPMRLYSYFLQRTSIK